VSNVNFGVRGYSLGLLRDTVNLRKLSCKDNQVLAGIQMRFLLDGKQEFERVDTKERKIQEPHKTDKYIFYL
jgi:hypothetical protein